MASIYRHTEMGSPKRRLKRMHSLDVNASLLTTREWYDPIGLFYQWKSFWMGSNILSWFFILLATGCSLFFLTIGTHPGATMGTPSRLGASFFFAAVSGLKLMTVWYPVWKEAVYRSRPSIEDSMTSKDSLTSSSMQMVSVTTERKESDASRSSKVKDSEMGVELKDEDVQETQGTEYTVVDESFSVNFIDACDVATNVTNGNKDNSDPENLQLRSLSLVEELTWQPAIHRIRTKADLKALKKIGEKNARSAKVVMWCVIFPVVVLSFVKEMVRSNGNSTAWICGGSSANVTFVIFSVLEILVMYFISPLAMFLVLTSYPHENHRKIIRSSEENPTLKKDQNCCWGCSHSMMTLIRSVHSDTIDSTFAKISISLLCIIAGIFHLLELTGIDLIKFSPYSLLLVGLIVLVDAKCFTENSENDNNLKNRKEFHPMYALLYSVVVLSVPSGFMSFLRDVANRVNIECHFAIDYNYAGTGMYASLAVFLQLTLLLTMYIASAAYGSRKSVMYGGLARMMGDVFTALVLMEIAPFSSQFFFLLVLKFIGRLALDLDWIIYFPKWLWNKLRCNCCDRCGCCCGKDGRNNQDGSTTSTTESDAEKYEEYIEQFELSNLSLFTEAVALSAILVVFGSVWLVAQGQAACTTLKTCPYYQPVVNVPLFARLISCNRKMHAAFSSYFVLWFVCGTRIAVQKAFFNRRFKYLDERVQALVLKASMKEKQRAVIESISSHGMLSNQIKRTTRKNMLTIDSNGCLVLHEKHSLWKTLSGVSVIVQILVVCSGLNLRPFGVGPTTWVTPSLNFLCDTPATIPLLNTTLRWKSMICPQDISQNISQNIAQNNMYEDRTRMANQSITNIQTSMQMYGSLHHDDEMTCCSILRVHAIKSGTPVRMGLVQPEPEPEAEAEAEPGEMMVDSGKNAVPCAMYNGWLPTTSEQESEPEPEPSLAEPEPEPEPE